ncbi:hepatitis A virus cellular receptor 1 homolog [Cheilinus undulatus]|uniref:hepatitis A virus cellular receptor 1 homolog n=1 Tax=Cheilinus undulatus TaxID=241271 RepID=UPI001BD259A0|nr:hepatitis A virus cellular receptor 1 homolog [Cheilinus undulatus]XP_041655436.1 hepatitis A virus cellular receptor 1 homolog [Cheilinus undulatus]
MKVHQTLICFFFLTLRDGGTALLHTDIGVRTETEGRNIEVSCTFTVSGKKRMFCRNDCDEEILVQTDGVRASSGRYSIEYKESVTTIYVSITNLTKSDSGKYKCYLERGLAPDSSETFELRVIEAQPPTEQTPSSAETPSTFTLTATQSPNTSGVTTPSSVSSETTKSLQQTSASGIPLYMRLVLVVVFITSSAAVMIVVRMRTRKDPDEQPHGIDIIEMNRVNEEVREDRRESRA